MSSITSNCGHDANQVSHERLRDMRIPEGRAVLLGSEEIDREHLESYAICKPGQSRLVVTPQQAARSGTLGGGQAHEGGRSSQLRRPRDTALRRPTPPAAAQPPSAREAVLPSRFCRQAIRCCRSVTLCFLVDQRRNHDDPGEHHKYGHEEPSRHTRAISASAIVMPPTVTVAIVKTPHDRLPHSAQNPRQVSLVHLLPPRRERHGERQHS